MKRDQSQGHADSETPAGQGHSNSGSPLHESALVQHLFKGSWKGDHQFEEAMKLAVDVPVTNDATKQS